MKIIEITCISTRPSVDTPFFFSPDGLREQYASYFTFSETFSDDQLVKTVATVWNDSDKFLEFSGLRNQSLHTNEEEHYNINNNIKYQVIRNIRDA